MVNHKMFLAGLATATVFLVLPSISSGWQTYDPSTTSLDEILDAWENAHGLTQDCDFDSLKLTWVIDRKEEEPSRYGARNRSKAGSGWGGSRTSAKSPADSSMPHDIVWRNKKKFYDSVLARQISEAEAFGTGKELYIRSLGSLFLPNVTERGRFRGAIWLTAPIFGKTEARLESDLQEIDGRPAWVLSHPDFLRKSEYYIDCESKLISMYRCVESLSGRESILRIDEFQVVDGIQFPLLGQLVTKSPNEEETVFDFRVNVTTSPSVGSD